MASVASPAFQAAVSDGKTASDTLDLYANWASNYEADMEDVGWRTPQNVANIVKEVVDPPLDAKILDVAAGTGLLSKFLWDFGYTNLDALDASAEMLEIAKGRNIFTNSFVSFVGGGAKLPYEKESYDMVVMSGAFVAGHCGLDAWDDMLDSIKPGGHVVASITKRYLKEVPAYCKMEEYVEELCGRKNGLLKEKRECENCVRGDPILVWVIQKLA